MTHQMDGNSAPRWHVQVDQTRSFDILESEPLLSDDHSSLTKYGRVPGRRLVLMDDAIHDCWAEPFRAHLIRHGVEATVVPVPGGEESKSMNVVLELIEYMRAFGLDRRRDPLIVVGGGAVLDVGGFAASMYRRGVPYIRVPTTVLAYVDASVGIKTGVNHGPNKNLLGSFYPPVSVLLEREFFSSLPAREFSSGQGEILKLGLACDPELFEMLDDYRIRDDQKLAPGDELGAQILRRAVTVMVEELRPNLFEHDLCRPVDLGHTFSQPLEMMAGLRHGEAVGIDLQLSAIIAAERGLLPHRDVDRLIAVAAGLGLPVQTPGVDPELLWHSQLERVQHRGGTQHTPLPTMLGRCTFVEDLRREEVYGAVEYLEQKNVSERVSSTNASAEG